VSLVLHPRAATGDRLQVWVGAFDRTAAPALRWFLDGQPAEAQALRPLASAREDRKAPVMVSPGEPRAFTGVFELGQGLAPGSVHEVQAATQTEPAEASRPLRVRLLPAEVPAGLGDSFNVLLVSCFHQIEDPSGLAGNLVAQLPGPYRPDLTLLLGDQVYHDLPTLMNFRDRVDWLAGKFEDDYTANWQRAEGYAQILDAAPSASLPDDHEYWNNAPHPSPIIQNTFTQEGRDRWARAARAMYEAFQLTQPGGFATPLELDVPPLSIFLMDSRSFRRADLKSTLPPGVLQRFKDWAARVAQAKRFGVVVTGQSFFEDPATGVRAKVADRHLANYGDYDAIMSVILDLARAGRPVLCITGDVHFGRVMRATQEGDPATTLYEVISSPTSLVTTVGADQVSQLTNNLRGLFGEKDPWPRHSGAAVPPDPFAPGGVASKLRTEVLFPKKKEKGNHVAILSFRAAGFGLEMRVSYWYIDRRGKIGPPLEVGPISLVPTR
jgi:hypothetical protein